MNDLTLIQGVFLEEQMLSLNDYQHLSDDELSEIIRKYIIWKIGEATNHEYCDSVVHTVKTQNLVIDELSDIKLRYPNIINSYRLLNKILRRFGWNITVEVWLRDTKITYRFWYGTV